MRIVDKAIDRACHFRLGATSLLRGGTRYLDRLALEARRGSTRGSWDKAAGLAGVRRDSNRKRWWSPQRLI